MRFIHAVQPCIDLGQRLREVQLSHRHGKLLDFASEMGVCAYCLKFDQAMQGRITLFSQLSAQVMQPCQQLLSIESDQACAGSVICMLRRIRIY